jgi:hypothetical protein
MVVRLCALISHERGVMVMGIAADEQARGHTCQWRTVICCCCGMVDGVTCTAGTDAKK